MPVIKPRGLLKGDRLAQLSDEAKLYWPFLYAGSNGYGRFELNYRKIVARCFEHFRNKPPQSLVHSVIAEYKQQQLLFIYEANGTLWGAWDSAAKQNFYTHDDERSPVPPEPAFSEWKRSYRERKAEQETASKPDDLAEQFRASSENDLQSIETQRVSYKDRDSCGVSGGVSEVISEGHGLSQTDTSISISKTSISKTSKTSETSTCAGATAILMPEPSDLGIEGWDELVELGSSVQMVMDPDPSSDLCQRFWRHLSFEDRLKRLTAFREKKACGQFDDPRYVPSLENFVRTKYRESHRPSAKPIDRGAALIARYASEEKHKPVAGSSTHGHSPPKGGIGGMSLVAGTKTG